MDINDNYIAFAFKKQMMNGFNKITLKRLNLCQKANRTQ